MLSSKTNTKAPIHKGPQLKSSLSTHKITWYGTQSQKYKEKKKKFLIDFSFWFDQILGSYQYDSYVLCPQKKKQKLANC